MSSGSRMDSLQGLGGQTKDNASREQQHTQPKLQRTVLPPIRPEPRTALPPKSEAALKKHVHRQHTSLRRLRAREQMIFPGWGVQPHSCRELLYVYPPHHSPPKSVQRGFETQQLPSLQPIQGCKQRRTPGQNTQSSATYKHKKQRSVNPPSKSTTTIVEPVQEKPFSLLPLEDFFYPKGYKSDQNELLEIEQRAERQSMCLYGLKLAETPFVVNFRLRKIFFYWHVHALEQHKQRTIGDPVFLLENQLPFACPITGPALREIKGKCYQMCDKEYCRITTGQTITLQEFLDSQLKHTEELLEDLKAFKEQIKEILVSAKEKLEIMEELNNIELRETSPDEPDPEPSSASSTTGELTVCTQLVEYLFVNTLHDVVVKAASGLLTAIREQVAQTPSQAAIRGTDHKPEGTAKPTEVKANTTLSVSKLSYTCPLFTCKVMQDSDTLVFKPSEEDFQDTMEDVVRLFEETVLTVPSLKSDSESDSEDCDPMEEEEASCFLKLILEGSSSLQSIKQSTRESIRFSFEAAKVYGRTFETFSESFEENKGLDPEPEQQQDLDVAYYNKKLESDKRRLNQISYIQDKRSLGLLLVENAQLAKKCQTSSRLSFKATSEVIVQKAIRRRDIVLNRMSETLSKLKTKPSTKAEMLNYIKFLKTTNRKTLELEDTVIPVCQMYEVIQTYSLNLSYQDVIDFESLYPCFDDYLVQVSKYIVDMDGTMKKQCQSLDVDLKELQYP